MRISQLYLKALVTIVCCVKCPFVSSLVVQKVYLLTATVRQLAIVCTSLRPNFHKSFCSILYTSQTGEPCPTILTCTTAQYVLRRKDIGFFTRVTTHMRAVNTVSAAPRNHLSPPPAYSCHVPVTERSLFRTSALLNRRLVLRVEK